MLNTSEQNMERLLLIDGNNLAMRAAYAFNLFVNLTDFSKEFDPDMVMDRTNHFPTGVLHGFFKSLAAIRAHYPEHYIAIVWDGGYHRRSEISKAAMNKGIIPETYKENRRRKDPDEQTRNYIKQKDLLREALSMTNFPQIVVDGEEADDVIASYVFKYLSQANNIMLATNDKDYFQLIDKRVFVLRGDEIVDPERFAMHNDGIKPTQWIEVAAFCGDAGDNIFGVPGWGETTAIRTIKEWGTFERAMANFHTCFDHLRTIHPDLSGDELKMLKDMKSSNGRAKFPNIGPSTPFTGVAMALENGKVKKMPKTSLTALMYEERAMLSRTLKAMKTNIDLPNLPYWRRCMEDKFVAFCDKYGLKEVSSLSGRLCAPQPANETPQITFSPNDSSP
jgi:5'-3' exonuclease